MKHVDSGKPNHKHKNFYTHFDYENTRNKYYGKKCSNSQPYRSARATTNALSTLNDKHISYVVFAYKQ